MLSGLKLASSYFGFQNNTIVPIALDLPCVRSLILLKKLRVLVKLMSDDMGSNYPLSGNLFAALAMRDIYNISIVTQCLYLEDFLDLNCTSQCNVMFGTTICYP